jgi:glycerophosphoryl diester phosphodiesterase
MKLSILPVPAIIAHRGASAYAPENTLAAFKLALQQGADAIELDAKLSADHRVVVIHDQAVDRTTPHRGRIRDLAFDDLRAMDAGSHFDDAFKGEPIPSLEAVFEEVGSETYINVELTNYHSLFDDLPQKVAELVHKHNVSERVFFSSFNIIALIRIHRLLPDAPIGLLAISGKAGSWARGWMADLLTPQSLHPERSDATCQLVEKAHRKGRKVFVYTVNQEEEMRRLFSIGVDGIFTDDPVLGLKIRGKLESMPSESQDGR